MAPDLNVSRDRRRLLAAGAGVGGGLLLSGCARVFDADALNRSPAFQRLLTFAQDWTRSSQRLLLTPRSLAREYAPADLSPVFHVNGTDDPGGDDYRRHVGEGFANWRLTVRGLVARPLSLSVAQLRLLPSRTQITRHDCVEGWSAIGQWTGVPLALLLAAAGVRPPARYVVFRCADNLDGPPPRAGEEGVGRYYESCGLEDARHPQTLIAYALNGRQLKVGNGAPLRLRLERQLGYKQAKYLQQIEVVDRLDHLYGGKGGYWEDNGYEWYAGI